MSKGTPSQGLRNKRLHISCKRCGKASFHVRKFRCSSCGFPDAKMRKYSWAKKQHRRVKEGTGRRRHLKDYLKKSPFPLK